MKSVNRILLLGMTLLFVLSKAYSAELAPDFAIKAMNKNLSELRGTVVYVDFWASWCGPCRKSFPWLNKIQQTYQQHDFTVIAVNLDVDKTLADEFLAEFPAGFPVVYDPDNKIAQAYQLVGMPSSYIINRQGEIAFAHAGFSTKKIAQYEKELATLLEKK